MRPRKIRKLKKASAWPFIAMMGARKGHSHRRGPKWSAGGWDGDDLGAGFANAFGGGMGAGRRGRRRRARMFAQGELRLALLHLVGERPRHGYELIKAIEDLTQGAYAPSPGAVYPTLNLMVDEGVIKEAPSDGARKIFTVTKEGASELEVRGEEVEALLAKLSAQGEHATAKASPDLFRAMGNLANVLRNRARSGGLEKTSVDEIVDLIDELAKRIERL